MVQIQPLRFRAGLARLPTFANHSFRAPLRGLPSKYDHHCGASTNTLDGRWRDVKNRMRQELSTRSSNRTTRRHRHRPHEGDGAAEDHGGTRALRRTASRRNTEVTATSARRHQIEMLAMSDLSLMVKAGVQWGLFGGASRTWDRAASQGVRPETHRPGPVGLLRDDRDGPRQRRAGAGDDRDLRPSRRRNSSSTPHPHRGARIHRWRAETARVAAVFAQLITPDGEGHGVHRFVVPIRDDEGDDLPGVTTSASTTRVVCRASTTGHPVRRGPGSPGQPAEQVRRRLRRWHLSSPIENPGRRFFTMLGTLSEAGSPSAAARGQGRGSLDIAARYPGTQAVQSTGGRTRVPIMDYLVHQAGCSP